MTTNDRPRVFLDITIDREPSGRFVIELFNDHTPKTCENFRQLCTGQHKNTSYAGCLIHRVIDEFMIQGGDIANNDGTGVLSIYGKEFADENLSWREMDAAGLVCSANRGRDTNGSQFFITLEPQSHLNGKHTIFGRLLSGQDLLRKIVSVSVDNDDRPNVPIVISRCGELEKKRKRQLEETHSDHLAPASLDRGRRRESHDSDVEMDTAEVLRKTDINRRQSDNTVDEGIRGRPRQRSGQRANVLAEDDSGSNEHSPVKMHKRKRSQSPSRHAKAEKDGRPDERRRRRSLPNQYDSDRDRRSPRRPDDRYDYRRPDHRHDQRQHQSDRRFPDRRAKDRWTPYHSRDAPNSGRLDDGADYDDTAPAVKFKGRGVMKYREPDRF